jgi:hypothetical protein
MPEIKTVRGPLGRHYVHPTTGEVVPSVTTILSVLDKPALVGWAAKTVATYAAENHDALTALDVGDRVALLKGVPWRNRDRAADRGTDAHTYAERRMVFGLKPQPTTRSEEKIDAVLDTIKPDCLLTEATIWNQSVGYAGTFDGIWKVGSRTVLIDWKSGKGVYPESGLQAVAYGHGEQIVTASDIIDMPRVDEAWIVHVPEDGPWSINPVSLSNPMDWMAFRATRAVWQWQAYHSDLILGQKRTTN